MSQQAETFRRCSALVTALMLAATLAACSKATAPANTEPAPGAEAPAAPSAEAPAAEAPAAPSAGAPAAPAPGAKLEVQGSDRYALDRDGTRVALGVTPGQGSITFQLATAPSDPRCNLTLSGTAKEKGGDVETREDEQGELVAVTEYVYESQDCGAIISIAMDDRATAWVSTYDCTRVPESCWLTSVGPLRK